MQLYSKLSSELAKWHGPRPAHDTHTHTHTHTHTQLPLESERNGIIISYTIFYRETPANASLDPPFMNITYLRGQEEQHSLIIENLKAMISYDIKILASTAAGDGPESPVFTATTKRRM